MLELPALYLILEQIHAGLLVYSASFLVEGGSVECERL
jgi:hypothetical protein